ncbi:MAG: 6-phosphofructokinase [Caldilineales bacterium]|nr:6-phosphofructokinase [Caldilineales bacterium]
MANINKITGVIGILTGGGDVPGLNPAIRAVTIRALREGYKVVGIRHGWAGAIDIVRDDKADNSDNFQWLTEEVVNRAGRTGGTFLHSSRTRPSTVSRKSVPAHLQDQYQADTNDLTPEVLKNLAWLGVDYIIPIGGDDTLSYGARIHTEGFPVVSIPKTMDNDVFGTDYCIGFSTAVTRSVDLITNLRTSVGSHERIGVVELFGRNSGETSLISAYCAGVDRAIISEVPFDVEKLSRLLMEDKARNPSNYCIVTISEGATMIAGQIHEYGEEDAYGHKKLGGIGLATSEALKGITGQNIIYQQLAYLMRSGAPDALDRIVAANYGSLAVGLAARGVTGRMVALREGRYTHVAADYTTRGIKRVDVDEFYDSKEYRPKVAHVEGKPMFLY